MVLEMKTGTLYQPRGVGWGGRGEGVSKGRGCMPIYVWFMLRFDRKQQNSVKQQSFKKKKRMTWKNKIKKDTCTPVFTATLFTIARTW